MLTVTLSPRGELGPRVVVGGADQSEEGASEQLGGETGPVLAIDLSADTPLVLGERAARRWRRYPAITLDATGLPPATAAALAQGIALGAWRYGPVGDTPHRLAHLAIEGAGPDLAAAWARAEAAAMGCCFARDLVALPGNVLNPDSFADHLAPLRQAGVAIEVLDAAALGCGGLAAVGAASPHAPRLIVLRWAGAGPPVCFVGKGITFDTGGICVKPADRMWEMRADMAGAAACCGAMLAIARRRAPQAAIAVLAVAENALGGGAYRPGDVLRSLAGTTVEVVDTDAEGRLALMDALAFASRAAPRAIVDAATLTGSAVVALGHHRAALFSADDTLSEQLVRAGEACGERLWRMPLDAAHRRALDSDIADLRHCVPGSGHPDACQAAAFLREFVGEIPWAHLDIAGVDLRPEEGEDAGWPTGFGARLLDAFAERDAEAA